MNNGILSLVLFLIEFSLLVFTFKKGRQYPYFWNVVPILILLQLYQLLEFILCTTTSYSHIVGPLAFVTITFLPPTGYHLVTKLVGWKHKDYLIGYLLATGFGLFYALTPNSVMVESCNPYFAIYSFKSSPMFSYYYSGFLVYAVSFLALHIYGRGDKIRKNASIGLLIGYLSFMMPMTILLVYDNSNFISVTSIMCKFALFLAMSLGMMTNKQIM